MVGSLLFDVTALAPQLLLGIAGAGLAGVAVLALATRSVVARTAQGFALVGVAVSAVLGSGAATLVLLDAQTLDEYRFWLVGSLAGRGTATLLTVAPVLLLGVVLALSCVWLLNALALGDEVAQGLGVRLLRRPACWPAHHRGPHGGLPHARRLHRRPPRTAVKAPRG